MILEMPEILRFLRHVQVVFITVIFPLVYGNGTNISNIILLILIV